MICKNYTEQEVLREVDVVLEQIEDICKCQKCRQDIIAWALNRLPARYAVTDLGNAWTKIDQQRPQTKAEITVRLLEAVKVVKANTRH